MSALDLALTGSEPDATTSCGLGCATRVVLAAGAIGCALALLTGWQADAAIAVADWLGLGVVNESTSEFLVALSGR